MYVNLTPVNSPTYGTKNQTTSAGDTTTHPGCGPAFVLAARRISNLAGGDCERCWRDARRNLLAFQNKSDLFSEIWELSESNIGELEIEYQAKFPDDPLSVLREILVHILEATVTEERRRLLMEIIFHKCEFVGEMVVVQQAQRSLCLESYDRIEQTLKHCINAKMLPENLLTRRAAILMRSFISGLMENWLFAPQSFDLKKKLAPTSRSCWRCINCVRRCARRRSTAPPDNIRGKLWTFSVSLFCLLQA